MKVWRVERVARLIASKHSGFRRDQSEVKVPVSGFLRIEFEYPLNIISFVTRPDVANSRDVNFSAMMSYQVIEIVSDGINKLLRVKRAVKPDWGDDFDLTALTPFWHKLL